MSDKTKLWQEIIQGAVKVVLWLIVVGAAIIAKITYDARNSDLTKKQIRTKVVLSFFCGGMATIVCQTFGYNKWLFLIAPAATLFGETLIIYIMLNGEALLDKIIRTWTNGKKKDE